MARKARLAALGAASAAVSIAVLVFLAPARGPLAKGGSARRTAPLVGLPAGEARPSTSPITGTNAFPPSLQESARVVLALDEDREATEVARRAVVNAIEECVEARVAVRWSER